MPLFRGGVPKSAVKIFLYRASITIYCHRGRETKRKQLLSFRRPFIGGPVTPFITIVGAKFLEGKANKKNEREHILGIQVMLALDKFYIVNIVYNPLAY